MVVWKQMNSKEKEKNEENPVFFLLIIINWGGGVGGARSIQLLYLMAYQLYPIVPQLSKCLKFEAVWGVSN